MRIRQQSWTRVGVLAALSVLALFLASITIWHGPAWASPPAQDPGATRTNLRQVDCPVGVAAYSNVCISWDASGSGWPSTEIRLYKYNRGADRPTGNPITNHSGWNALHSSSGKRDLVHYSATGNAVKLVDLEPDQLYMVAARIFKDGETRNFGASATVRTTPLPVVSNLRIAPDCVVNDSQMCLEWDLDQRDGSAEYTLSVYRSGEQSALADTGSAIDAHHVSSHTVTNGYEWLHYFGGLTAGKWHRFKLEASIGGETQVIWTPESYLTRPSVNSNQPQPRCVTRFDSADPWMGLDGVADGAKGLLVSCRPQSANTPPAGIRWDANVVQVDALDGQENYTSRYSRNDGSFQFVPMPGIRSGEHYRVSMESHYAVPGTDSSVVRSPARVFRMTYGGSSGTAPCYSCDTSISSATPITVSMAAMRDSISEYHGNTRFKVRLNRKLTGDETVSVPLVISGGAVGTDFDLSLSGMENASGIRLDTSGVRPVVNFSSGGWVAIVHLRALPKTGAATRNVEFSLGAVTSALTATVNPAWSSDQVTIEDDDGVKPLVTIATQATSIAEGDSFGYTLRATPSLATEMPVRVRITYQGDYGLPNGERLYTMPTTGELRRIAHTEQNSDWDKNGSVTVEVLPSHDYVLNGDNTITVSISDDDARTVSVSAASSEVTEGNVVNFAISVTPKIEKDLPVHVQVIPSRGFGLTGHSRWLTVPPSGTVSFRQTPSGDNVVEPNGAITLTVLPHSSYVLGDPASVTVTILDDDVVAPTMTISGGDSVTEGKPAVFTISGTPVQKADYPVKVSIAQTGAFGVQEATEKVVTVPAAGSYTLNVNTVNDTVKESDGSVTVTLVDGDRYNLGSEQTATVAVVDNDTPTVSVSPTSGAITEGGKILLQFSAIPRQSENVVVNVQVDTVGDFGVTSEKRTVTIPTGFGLGGFQLVTLDDATHEPDGTVTATILPSDEYRVSPDAGVATYTVEDNDPAFSVSMDVGVPVVWESTDGATHTKPITISLNRQVRAGEEVRIPITIDSGANQVWRLYHEGNMGTAVKRTATGPQSEFVIGPGGRHISMLFKSDPDSITEDREVTLSFGTGNRAPSATGYEGVVGTGADAVMTIKNTGASVSLSADDATVSENNGTTKLRITLDRVLKAGESVRIPFTVSGGDPGTHWNITDPGNIGTAAARTAYEPESEVTIGAGGQEAMLHFRGRPDGDSVDTPITIAFGTGNRAPSYSGPSRGAVAAGNVITITVLE